MTVIGEQVIPRRTSRSVRTMPNDANKSVEDSDEAFGFDDQCYGTGPKIIPATHRLDGVAALNRCGVARASRFCSGRGWLKCKFSLDCTDI